MQVRQATSAIGPAVVASAQEQVAVAELMEPAESLVGRPSLTFPRLDPMAPSGAGVLNLLLLSPGEPTDEPEDR